MVKFEVELKQKCLLPFKKTLLEYSRILEGQTGYICITPTEFRVFNILTNLNHDFQLKAVVTFYLNEIADDKQVAIKSEDQEARISLNKFGDLVGALSNVQYYNSLNLKLIKDSHGHRSLRVKMAKQGSNEIAYVSNCGIEFTHHKFTESAEPLFECDTKSFYLRGLIELSHKLEESLMITFKLAENKLEAGIESQFLCMTIDVNYWVAKEHADQKEITFMLYHKFCKKLFQVVNFENGIKIGLLPSNELFIETTLQSQSISDQGTLGRFRYTVPFVNTKVEEGPN